MGEVIARKLKGGGRAFYLRYVDSDGKRKMRASKQPTREFARKVLAEVEGRIARGRMGIPEVTADDRTRATITVRELAARFLGDVEGAPGYAPPRIKNLPEYRQQARSIFKRRILPHLGERAAASVRLGDVERMRDQLLAAGLRRGSVGHALSALSTLYRWARRLELVDCGNPVTGCERLTSDRSLDFLDAGEVGRLLAHVEEHAAELAPGVPALVAVALYTGMRKGELYGLRWQDVHLDAARVDVMRSYRHLPKSGKPRHLPLHAGAVAALRHWRRACPSTSDGLVFPVGHKGAWEMGRRWDHLDLHALLVAASCHVPAKPWHALRHTFASHFMMAGGNILTLQKLLGHSDIKQTLIYAHLAPDFMAAEVARLAYPAPAPARAAVASLDGARRRRRAADEGRG